ncbi:MAG: cobalamin-dependent protein [Phycisphaerae bacterium]|nr:cobalamin-dependent protein [Phycisphaerae bacterium]
MQAQSVSPVTDQHPVHPLRSKAKVLLCSVFGPYGLDDAHGSRTINPMELYHNQVTRAQGPFSLRMHHRSWGLMFIQANISAPCTLLDFPSRERFVQELSENRYDIVGISSIIPNTPKVAEMCKLIRAHQPGATIVVGGHISNVPDLKARIDADHVVRGEGIRWFRRYLGEDENQPIRHPHIWSAVSRRSMGVQMKVNATTGAATLVPSVGCPLGCNFCSTSAMFGGKGKSTHFYRTGDELFEIMCQLEREMKVHSFFVMDENFLLQRPRALRLLELMQKNDKAWSIYVFSSANVLKMYTMEQLVGLGVSWVWMGLEGEDSRYEKLKGHDSRELVRTLQANGICVLGSTIIGLENHTLDNIDDAIAYAVSHATEFHQFMLYTPIPGTPLHAELSAQGRILTDEEIAPEDVHGQYRFNYRHAHLPPGSEEKLVLKAFERDFEVNGPSVLRIVPTLLAGWRKYRDCGDARIRRRFKREVSGLSTTFAAAIWAARRWFKDNPIVLAKLETWQRELNREFPVMARLFAGLFGRYVLKMLNREVARLAAGWTLEPETFYEKNYEDPKQTTAGRVAELIRTAVATIKSPEPA